MKIGQFKQVAELEKDDERYRIYDYTMGSLIISLTELHPYQETRGHEHKGIEEVYYFMKGRGQMELGDGVVIVEEGDIIPIQDGIFHKIFNPTAEELLFYAIFQKYERN